MDTINFDSILGNDNSLADDFRNAVRYHQSGDFQSAERFYEKVLAKNNAHPDANHNMGVLAHQFKQNELALTYIRKAILAEPTRAQFWLSFLEVLIVAGRLEEASLQLDECLMKGMGGEGFKKLKDRLAAPTAIELKQALRLFDAGLFDDTILYLNEIIIKYTHHAFAYKLIAACYVKKEDYEQAIVFAQQSLNIFSEDAESNNVLGFSFYKLGNYDAADIFLSKANALNPDNTKVLFNLVSLYIDTAKWDKAKKALDNIIVITPESAEAYKNLGNICFFQRCYDEAFTYYQRAIELDPTYWAPYNNLAVIHHKQNKIEQAIQYYEKSYGLCGSDDRSAVLFGWANSVYVLGDYSTALQLSEQASKLTMNIWVLDSIALSAILFFLEGDFKLALDRISQSRGVSLVYDKKEHSLPMYFDYLHKLIISHTVDATKSLPKLYVVGESHCLALHKTNVSVQDAEFMCESKWILGVKAHHLGNDQDNYFKRQFNQILSDCPNNSHVLLTIGEIDCRLNEGMFSVYRKNKKTLTLESIVENTAGNYMNYLVNISKHNRLNFIVCGVPAPNIPLQLLSSDEVSGFVGMIQMFNKALSEHARNAGFMFLDTYKLTNRGDGISSTQWHIDMMHLTRDAYLHAFQNHLILSNE